MSDEVKMDSVYKETFGDWIFFLTFDGKLPHGYLKLAESLNEKNITLVPIAFDQYLEFTKRFNHINLMVLEGSLRNRALFRSFFKRHFEFAIKSQNMTLFHVSSFKRMRFKSNMKLVAGYHYYLMPVSAFKVADDVSRKYETKQYNKHKWPGGKRAKVPVLEV